MANLPISVLPNVTATGVTPNDLLVIVNYDTALGDTKNITALDLKTYINSGDTSLYEVGSGAGSTQRIGLNNDASGDCSVISGGQNNTASSSYSTVGGGVGNTSIGKYSTVSGGFYNSTEGFYSAVSGGRQNIANCDYSTVGGG